MTSLIYVVLTIFSLDHSFVVQVQQIIDH